MILKIKNLNKSFGKMTVLNNINLKVDKPRLIALIAPNGSGKTTLFNIICNLEKAQSGKIYIDGELNKNESIFQNLSYMQDNTILYPLLTGKDHLDFIRSAHKIEKKRLENLVNLLKMDKYINRKVQHYSLGMKQHLLLASAILPKPKIILMDEPLNGLDPASVVLVRQIIADLHKNGTTILLSSHNLDQIEKLTTDIFFLKNNKLISYNEVLNIKEYRHYQVITDDVQIFYENVKNVISSFNTESKHKCSFKCTVDEFKLISQTDKLNIYDYQEIKASLEQIYFDLYEDYSYDYTI